MKSNKLDLNYIRNKFESFKYTSTHSVLIPIFEDKNGSLNLLYQKRSMKINQPGDISFPGGRIEDGETEEFAAIRETCEELNISRDKIKLLSKLTDFHRTDNKIISSFVGIIDIDSIHDLDDFNEDETELLFSVPIDWLINNSPQAHSMEAKLLFKDDFPFEKIQYGKDYGWDSRSSNVYFYEYNDFVIWGTTAFITKKFIDNLF